MRAKNARVIYLIKIISDQKILCDESNYIHRDERERKRERRYGLKRITQASRILCLGIKRQI